MTEMMLYKAKLVINCRLKCVNVTSPEAEVFVTDVDILDYVSVSVFTVKDEKSSFSSDATTAKPIKLLPNCTFFRTTSSSCSSDMLAVNTLLAMPKRASRLP